MTGESFPQTMSDETMTRSALVDTGIYVIGKIDYEELREITLYVLRALFGRLFQVTDRSDHSYGYIHLAVFLITLGFEKDKAVSLH